MADFCKACSIHHFGKDYNDLAGLSTEKQTKEGRYPVVLCEGCGAIQVDHEGRCVSNDCLEAGKPGHGLGSDDPPSEDDGDGPDPYDGPFQIAEEVGESYPPPTKRGVN